MAILKQVADITDVRLGVSGASEVYLGDVLVWPIEGCGITLRLPFGTADNPTAFIDESRPSKLIAESTNSVLVSDATALDGFCGDFTAGGNLLIRYPFSCDFLTRPFAIACNVKLAAVEDVVNLFDRNAAAGPGFKFYSFQLHADYVNFSYDNSSTGGAYNIKLFLYAPLTPGIWYRIIVQRDFAGQFTVYTRDLSVPPSPLVFDKAGTKYMPLMGGEDGYDNVYGNFRASLGYIEGQYFNNTALTFIGNDAVRQSVGITSVNHANNKLYIGGAGYIDDYSVTVCSQPYPSAVRIPAPGPDPHFNNVALLMHFNEFEEQEFVDSGPYGLEPVKVGAPAIIQMSTSGQTNNLTGISPFAGQFGSGLYGYGAGNFLTFPDAGDLFDLGAAGDFTIEFWAAVNGLSGGGPIMGYHVTYPSYYGDSVAYYGWDIRLSSFNGYFQFQGIGKNPENRHFYGGTGTAADVCVGNSCVNQGFVVAANGVLGVYPNFNFKPIPERNHFAVTRSGDTLRLFFNGRLVAYGPVPFNFSTAFAEYDTRPELVPPVFVLGGYLPNSTSSAVSHIAEVRITRGVARYTSDFAVQSRAFPDAALDPTIPTAPTLLSIAWE